LKFPLHYPRVFRYRIVSLREELEEEIKKIHGKAQCYISLYGFNTIDGTRPDWSSCIIDRLLIECNYDQVKELLTIGKKYRKEVKNVLGIKNCSIWYLGNNQFYFFLILKDEIVSIDEFKSKIKCVEDFYKKHNVKIKVCDKLDKTILMIGTLNLITTRFVIPIGIQEINKGLEYIDKLSRSDNYGD